MTDDYAARVRTLAARHNREWQLLVEEMDRERTRSFGEKFDTLMAVDETVHVHIPHVEAEEHA